MPAANSCNRGRICSITSGVTRKEKHNQPGQDGVPNKALLGLCTQCGFSSAIGTYPLDETEQERKLRLVAEIAARAWPHQARDIP